MNPDWPPQAGDIWQCQGRTYHAQEGNAGVLLREVTSPGEIEDRNPVLTFRKGTDITATPEDTITWQELQEYLEKHLVYINPLTLTHEVWGTTGKIRSPDVTARSVLLFAKCRRKEQPEPENITVNVTVNSPCDQDALARCIVKEIRNCRLRYGRNP